MGRIMIGFLGRWGLISLLLVVGCAAPPKKKEPIVDVKVSNRVRVTVAEDEVDVQAPNTDVKVRTDD